MFKKSKKSEYVLSIGAQETNIYRQTNIRITEGRRHWKKIVAQSISSYLGATSRYWDTTLRKDQNAELLCKHLNLKYPEFKDGWEFRVTASQDRFDIIGLGAGVAIELKSVRGNKRTIVTNATIFPDVVTTKYAVSDKFQYPTQTSASPVAGVLEDQILDVLVVCVNQVDDTVVGHAIVDGSYWGFTEKHYLDCIAYYTQVNEMKEDINKSLAPINSFAKGLAKGTFGKAIKMDLRKLITLTNPVGRLNIPGMFSVQG